MTETILSATHTAARQFGVQCALVLCPSKHASSEEQVVVTQLLEQLPAIDMISLCSPSNNIGEDLQPFDGLIEEDFQTDHSTCRNSDQLKKLNLDALAGSNAPQDLKKDIAAIIQAFRPT